MHASHAAGDSPPRDTNISVMWFWIAVFGMIAMKLPIMNNFGALPTMVISIIVLGFSSRLAPTTARRLATTLAVILLVLSSLSFFFPKTAARTPGAIAKLDGWMADTTPKPAQVRTARVSNSISVENPLVLEKHTRIISTRTLDIPVSCLHVYLRQGWKSYPKGGPVEIRNADGQLVHIDRPGVDYNHGYQPDGMYSFCAVESGDSNRRVEIYNDWRPQP